MIEKVSSARTTMWRMRFKLNAVTEKQSTDTQEESLDMDSSFNSRSTEFRAAQKVRSILPYPQEEKQE